MDKENLLGRFLRARRELVRPEDVGLLTGERRRVAGLRREEVAVLAGVSTHYYMRLEQGRERHPSAQVVEALARTFGLEPEAAAHLHMLAQPASRLLLLAPGTPARGGAGEREPAADDEVLGPHPRRGPGPPYDRPGPQPLGEALFAGHTYSGDLVRLVFLDPDARSFYPDWDQAARNVVAGLRAAARAEYDDPGLVALVGELSLRSETFRRLWARHEIRSKAHEAKRFQHPRVGHLTLTFESLTLNSAPGQQLVVYQAAPDSPSEHALTLLGSLIADDPPSAGRNQPNAYTSPPHGIHIQE